MRDVRPLGIVLRKQNIESPEQARQLAAEARAAVGAQDLPLIALREDDAKDILKVDVSNPAELGRQNSPEKARDAGERVAHAAADHGIQILFGPCLNIPVDKKKKQAEGRQFSYKQDVAAPVGLAYAEGLQRGGIIPVVKYYPAEAAPPEDGKPAVLDVERARLAELMYPFAEAVNRNIPGILVSHIAVPLLDKQDPSRSAALSPVLVRRVLRELPDWNYGNVILADEIANAGVAPEKAAVDALAAGCDAVVYFETDPARIKAVCDAIDKALQEGTLKKDDLIKSVARLDAMKGQVSRSTAAVSALDQVAEEKPAEQPQPAGAPESPEAPAETPDASAPQPEPVPPPSIQEPTQAEPGGPDAVPDGDTAEEPAPIQPPDEAPNDTAKPEGSPEPVEKDAAPEPAQPAPPAAEPVADPPAPVKPAANPEPDEDPVIHTVGEGDTLNKIARKYGVTPEQIVEWNNLPNSTIQLGSKLAVYADPGVVKAADRTIKQKKTKKSSSRAR